MALNNSTVNLTKHENATNSSAGSPATIYELLYLGIVEFLIVAGNSLVILAFMKGNKLLRTFSNYIVVNLAVTDLMVGCITLPIWMYMRTRTEPVDPDNDQLNKYFLPLDVLFGTNSIFSLACISVERMFAVAFPARHRNFPRRLIFFAIAFTWVLSTIFFVSSILLAQDFSAKYATVLFVINFLTPLVVIFVSYTVLFVAVVRLTKADNQAKVIAREIQIAKMLSIIIILFVICWALFFSLNMVFTYCESCRTDSRFDSVAYISKALHYSNSMMNFFVYALRSPDYREMFKVLLLKCDTKKIRQRNRLLSMTTGHGKKQNSGDCNGNNSTLDRKNEKKGNNRKENTTNNNKDTGADHLNVRKQNGEETSHLILRREEKSEGV